MVLNTIKRRENDQSHSRVNRISPNYIMTKPALRGLLELLCHCPALNQVICVHPNHTQRKPEEQKEATTDTRLNAVATNPTTQTDPDLTQVCIRTNPDIRGGVTRTTWNMHGSRSGIIETGRDYNRNE